MNFLIDNYDSFSYNLSQLIGNLTNGNITVLKNDDPKINNLNKLNPEHIILSPGPGRPENAGQLMDVLNHFIGKAPILGVCLGHQAIAEAYGVNVVHANKLMHGKPSNVTLLRHNKLFANCPSTFPAARYHSLAVAHGPLPTNLTIDAVSDDQEIMAISDEQRAVYGVQFHPESIMTDPYVANQIIMNFLAINTESVHA
ncbi:anthranilate synthase component II [Lentilactobacillus sp. SPB1-3]|uniref:Aminodeoxychorismate/anthranilate synthase component II n=1 Tax=Lentilactobacillus terminaliae TaxID=3003483 RepID=A0ACD5DEH0_9LACO|nr:aminodeoxychorismate/anthranilate synthase component II [Lentilactobacillus sp. SPB1-3]MCZ0976290.1 aminodeoxychorismate/anthranilate synthase component II [Lentilactobacillus sp. SPB1-3]